jgi:hypothetical protein
MSIPPQTYRMSIIDLVFARSYGMRFQEYGFGELGKKLLVDFLILDHFHRLLAGRDVLAISLSVAFPYDAIKHDTDLLPGGVLVERSGDQACRDLLVQIHGDKQFTK